MASAKNILLTGLPGAGKTTIVQCVAQSLFEKHVLQKATMGFYTEEVRSDGRRVGFDVVTLSGIRAPLARLGEGKRMVGRYCVDIPAFEQVCLPELSPKRETQLVVVDEIGKMEVFSDAFVQSVTAVLESGPVVLGVVPAKSRNIFIDGIKKRPDVEIVMVTNQNRNRLPEIVREMVLARIGEHEASS